MISKKTFCIAVLVALSVGSGPFNLTAPAIAKAAKGISKSSHNDDTPIRAQIDLLMQNLANGDAKGLSALWTENGNYIDEDGNVIKGRSALEKRFIDVFGENGKEHFELTPDTTRFLSDNVVVCEGTVLKKEGTKRKPETRFALVFVKENGNWLISTATETPIAESQQSHESLEELAWMVGEWKAERNGASVHMTADWAANKRFIHCKYEIKRPDVPLETDIQVIGYDPIRNQLVSWHFDSSGGYGYGSWYKRDDQWMVESTGIESNGSTSRAINIIQSTAPNEFSWQSVHRSVDGIAFADTNELKVQRVTQ